MSQPAKHHNTPQHNTTQHNTAHTPRLSTIALLPVPRPEGNLPVTAALVTEFLPTKDRAKMLCRIAGIFWGIGMISASLIGLILANVLGPG